MSLEGAWDLWFGGWLAAHRRRGSIIESMVIDMNEAQVRTLEQVRQVLAGTQAMEFQATADDAGRYAWIESVLRRFDFAHLSRADRGPLRAYLQRLSGYSRAQITRLIARWDKGKPLAKNYTAPRHAFVRRYTPADVATLADVDRAMGTLSGPATACVLRRQRDVFGDERFERLGSISVGHLYNLRNSAGYRSQRVVLTKTQPSKASTIGVRKAPAPEGRPGFIRIDSVHQGDLDGVKGVYHIDAVDCVTQWQIVASVQTISEAHLLSVIEEMAEPVSLRDPGLSRRQRQRVRQPQGGAVAGETAHRIHAQPPAPQQAPTGTGPERPFRPVRRSMRVERLGPFPRGLDRVFAIAAVPVPCSQAHGGQHARCQMRPQDRHLILERRGPLVLVVRHAGPLESYETTPPGDARSTAAPGRRGSRTASPGHLAAASARPAGSAA
jgi:hypothetical protein